MDGDNIRYYCRLRPPSPGEIPRGATNVCDFGRRRYDVDFGGYAWGWAEYPTPLEDGVAEGYEVVRCEPRQSD